MSSQAGTADNGRTARRLAQIARITISVLSMGFIFPHAIADGLDGDANDAAKTSKS